MQEGRKLVENKVQRRSRRTTGSNWEQGTAGCMEGGLEAVEDNLSHVLHTLTCMLNFRSLAALDVLPASRNQVTWNNSMLAGVLWCIAETHPVKLPSCFAD